MADAVVLGRAGPLAGTSWQVGRREFAAERRVVASFSSTIEPDVLDWRRASRGGAGRQAAREQGSGKQSVPADTSQPPCPHPRQARASPVVARRFG